MIQMLRFAVDILLLADAKTGKFLIAWNKYSVGTIIKFNKKKTKGTMWSNDKEEKLLDINFDPGKVDEVEELCYLGSSITKCG